ncbi:MAG: hypothetical protein K2W95_21140 [Candidatus Obscuribacterales bacterium]|nr:hypothetical protein [Candidatus Obscuribacterales bacterium]
MKRLKSVAMAACLSVAWGSLSTSAEPQASATFAQGAASPLIVVATYKAFSAPVKDATSANIYFDGIWTTYRVERLLRSDNRTKTGDILSVNHQFHDGSACEAPDEFTFSEKLLPSPGSSWILLLEPTKPGGAQYRTYRGTFGRLVNNEQNLEKVRRAMSAVGNAREK